jgi:hypothetical protein
MLDLDTAVERAHTILSAPALHRSEKASRGREDPKFLVGDLLVEADLSSADTAALAQALDVAEHQVKTYHGVAKAWPLERRVAASWSTHRELKDHPDRFDIIEPGMTLRRAREMIGKAPSDIDHPSRWSLERRVTSVVTWLLEPEVESQVREQLQEKRKARRARAAARMAAEERSAEAREALRELRDLHEAKSPERAALEAVAKLRLSVDYVRAIEVASASAEAFLPAHRIPDLVRALRDLGEVTVHTIASISDDAAQRSEALRQIRLALSQAAENVAGSSGKNSVVQGQVLDWHDANENPDRLPAG